MRHEASGSGAVKALQDFAKWAIREGAFQAADLDGLSIQEKAHELGLIEQTTYDPKKHGPSDCAEDGCEWFVFSAALSSLEQPSPAAARPTRVQAAFDVWRERKETGPNASALFEYIEALEAALSATEQPAAVGESAATIADRIANGCWLSSIEKHGLARRIRKAIEAERATPAEARAEALKARLDTARADAFEEAARIADGWEHTRAGQEIADAIRHRQIREDSANG